MNRIHLFLLALGIINTLRSGAQILQFKVPDTGQTNSFTDTFGEDSDYNENLVYIDVTDKVLLDSITGLMWQRGDGGEMTFEDAQVYADTATIGGYTDWRLPAPHEAYSIMYLQTANPALHPFFTNTGAEYWWTNKTQVGDANKVWVTNAGGGIGNHPKSETISAGGTHRFHTRLVRNVSAPALSVDQLQVSDNGDFFHERTSLVWRILSPADSMTWEQALMYTETQGFRLPNIKELQSLAFDALVLPCVPQSIFSGYTNQHIWSSTTLMNHSEKAWFMDVRFGLTTYAVKTARLDVWMVRDAEAVANAVNFQEPKELLYPNPVNSILNSSGSNSDEYTVYTCDGRIMYYKCRLSQLDCATWPKGLYMIRNERNGFVHRIVK